MYYVAFIVDYTINKEREWMGSGSGRTDRKARDNELDGIYNTSLRNVEYIWTIQINTIEKIKRGKWK